MSHMQRRTLAASVCSLKRFVCLSSAFAGFDVHVCFCAVFSQHMKFNSCGSSAEQKW